ncbi:uncharacterized protein LOC143920781 [Arctopsyche grandis]|uniref:uncharacterized protein LOC143920781 n=1 Tax=Arctopsyche grandis TaxID=121162 RepID=UPI00406D9A6C
MNTDKKILPIDIMDLCNILQCLGFNIKNVLKEYKPLGEAGTTIEVNCNIAGIKVVLESKNTECNCPKLEYIDENEKWEMSGTSGGIQVSRTENNLVFQRDLCKSMIMHVKSEVNNLVELLRTKIIPVTPPNKNILNKSFPKSADAHLGNSISVSSSCLFSSPPNSRGLQIKVETPGRCRSLDTLNDTNSKIALLPEPRALSASQKSLIEDSNQNIDKIVDEKQTSKVKTIVRQNTYTASPTNSHEPRHVLPSRTSSPIPAIPSTVILNLHQAEKIADDLMVLIQETIKTMEPVYEKSQSSLVMDVSKISVAKSQVLEPRGRTGSTLSTRSAMPFASSPNLSNIKEISKASLSVSKRRLSYKISPAVVKSEMKTNSLKRSIPKKLSSITSISPSFGVVGGIKKNLGLGSVLGNPIVGSYKSLVDKSGINNSAKAKSSLGLSSEVSEPKKKNLYSHIKSTIPRQVSSAKK